MLYFLLVLSSDSMSASYSHKQRSTVNVTVLCLFGCKVEEYCKSDWYFLKAYTMKNKISSFCMWADSFQNVCCPFVWKIKHKYFVCSYKIIHKIIL